MDEPITIGMVLGWGLGAVVVIAMLAVIGIILAAYAKGFHH